MKAILLGLLFFLLLPFPVYAQEELKIDSGAVTVTVTPAPEVQYALPFPGILPDHPLYMVKAARDRIVSFFISDPVKRAEFDLLQADKRLQAGLSLLHKEKPEIQLAISTISKGQNYFEEALVARSKAGKDLKDTSGLSDLSGRLYTAAQKHRDLLRKEGKNIPSPYQEDFQLLVKRSETLVLEAKKLQ